MAIIAVSTGGKKKPKKTDYVSEELTADSKVPKEQAGPTKPQRPPPPDISPEIVTNAKAVVERALEEKAKGDALYEEAMAAKGKGDETLWQDKLSEAREHFANIRDMWNEEIIEDIQGELPANCEYDADEVANHHIGKEAGKITKALERLAYITKQQRHR